jgi:formylglycine-generating enzyme required for sulfatase activity
MIFRQLPGQAPPATFVLIKPRIAADPPAFYMQVDKVTNAQFAAALKQKEMQSLLAEFKDRAKWAVPQNWLEKGPWQQRLNDPEAAQLPVMKVSAAEAHCFAKWLASEFGELPTAQQWDKAGGKFDDALGPFKVDWDESDAENRQKPFPVGTRERDQSSYGCRDMALNGKEWTRTIIDPPGRGFFPPMDLQSSDFLEVRGLSFRASRPYRFKPRPGVRQSDEGMEPCDKAGEDLGFRVVINRPIQ